MCFLFSCFRCFTPSTSAPDPSQMTPYTVSQVTNILDVPAHLISERLKELGEHASCIKCPSLRSGFKMNLSRSELNKTFTLEKLIELNPAQQLRFISRAKQTIKTSDSIDKPLYISTLLLAFREKLEALHASGEGHYEPSSKVLNELKTFSDNLPNATKNNPSDPLDSSESASRSATPPLLEAQSKFPAEQSTSQPMLSLNKILGEQLNKINRKQNEIFEMTQNAFLFSFTISGKAEKEQTSAISQLDSELSKLQENQKELIQELQEFMDRHRMLIEAISATLLPSAENGYDLGSFGPEDFKDSFRALKNRLTKGLEDVASSQYDLFEIRLDGINQSDFQDSSSSTTFSTSYTAIKKRKHEQALQEELQKIIVTHKNLLKIVSEY